MAKPTSVHRLGVGDCAHRLRNVLLRLAMDRDELLAEMCQTATDDKSLMRLIAREINEVVLPREIALRSEDGGLVTLTASNRRVTELQDGGVAVLPPGEVEPDDVARAYAQAITTLGQRAGCIALKNSRRAPQAVTNICACSASLLAEAGNILTAGSRMRAFLDLVQARVSGWVLQLTGDQATRHNGPQDVLDRLVLLHTITADHGARNGPLNVLDRTGPICVALTLSPGLQAIIATDGGDSLMLAVPDCFMSAVLENWQAGFIQDS